MRRHLFWLLVAVVAGIIWYIGYKSHGQYLQETNDAQIEADMVTVSPRVAGYVAAVLVQPSVYGTDNAAMLDALREAGPSFRAVAVVENDIGDAELDRLHEAGVRGVRCNIVDVQPEDKGRLTLEQLTALGRKIGDTTHR